MTSKKKQVNLKLANKKKAYSKPEIKEVWNENIGMTGAYLLEM